MRVLYVCLSVVAHHICVYKYSYYGHFSFQPRSAFSIVFIGIPPFAVQNHYYGCSELNKFTQEGEHLLGFQLLVSSTINLSTVIELTRVIIIGDFGFYLINQERNLRRISFFVVC